MVGGSNPPSATTPARGPLDDLAAAALRGAEALALPRDARLILAVSGGPDSMALLHGASRLVQADAVAWQLTVAHLDHALRARSSDDAAFVADAAAALGLPYECRREDVAQLARRDGHSIEEAGRNARYRFLEELAAGDGWIATAHTADDLAETVLLNLMRGSGMSGARGMPARRGRIVRPLIAERRERLRAWLDAAGAAYRIDESNADPGFVRNRVRHELLPLMESIRPGAIDRLVQYAALVAADDELLDEVAAVELRRRRGEDGTLDWQHPPAPALGRRLLRLAIGTPAPAAERIDALLEAAKSGRGGVTIELGGGRAASVRERRIRFE